VEGAELKPTERDREARCGHGKGGDTTPAKPGEAVLEEAATAQVGKNRARASDISQARLPIMGNSLLGLQKYKWGRSVTCKR